VTLKSGRHDHHHRLHDDITRRLETWIFATDPPFRRRAARQTRWAMADHLRCCHGARRVNHKTVTELTGLHDQLHHTLVAIR